MIKELALKVVDESGIADSNAAFDPATIWAIVEIIIEIIDAFNEYCAENDPEKAAQVSNDPSRLAKAVLKRMVRRKLGYRSNKTYGNEIVSGILAVGLSITSEEMAKAYEEL